MPYTPKKRPLLATEKDSHLWCAQVGPRWPFLGRNHKKLLIERYNRATEDKSLKLKSTSSVSTEKNFNPSVQIHLLLYRHGKSIPYTFGTQRTWQEHDDKAVGQLYPCPFCKRSTFTQAGLWEHLWHAVDKSKVWPVAMRDENNKLHLALTEPTRSLHSTATIQEMSPPMVLETEVIWWRKRKWQSKQHMAWPQATSSFILTDQSADIDKQQTMPKRQKSSQWESEKSVKEINPLLRAFLHSSRDTYLKDQEFIPLHKALGFTASIKPPKCSFMTPDSFRHVQMSEWMLLQGNETEKNEFIDSGLKVYPPNERWRRMASHRLIDEWTDVSQSERSFMKRWNDHVALYLANQGVVPDQLVAILCYNMNGKQSQQLTPEDQEIWLAHLLNLWEEKHLGRDDLLVLSSEYHEQRNMALLAEHVAQREEEKGRVEQVKIAKDISKGSEVKKEAIRRHGDPQNLENMEKHNVLPS